MPPDDAYLGFRLSRRKGVTAKIPHSASTARDTA